MIETVRNQKLRSGYGITEVGVIPDDWKVIDLSTLCTLQRGFDITESSRVPGNIPVYSSSGLCYYHNQAMAVPPGVVTGRKGLLGRVFLIREPYWPHDTTLWVKDFRGNSPAFVALVLEHFHLERLDAATSVPTLNRNNLFGHAIAIPAARLEQEAIANALSEVDDLITSLERLIGKKRAIKQGMMQELLTGRTRLDGLTKAWLKISLGELGTTVRGVGYNPSQDLSMHRTKHTVDLLRANNVQNGTLDLNDVQFVKRSRVRSNQFMQFGDVLVCAANGSKQLVGKAASINAVGSDSMTFGAFMMIFRPNPRKVMPSYAALHFQTKQYRDWIEVLLAGSSINNLKPSDVATFAILLPSGEEQRRIIGIFNEVDGELLALERRLGATRAIKQGMMQELLTGRTRLSAQEVTE